MRRRWVSISAILIVMFLIGGDLAEAKKSRSGRHSSRASVKKGSRAKASRSKTSHSKVSRAKAGRSRTAKIARGKRGRHGRIARGRNRRNYSPQASVADLPRVSSSTIAPERISEIQNALIKLGYLEGEASGQYDEKTIEAMKQFQAENKLPQSGYPSAHALKKLGVAKRSNDGYAVPVGTVTVSDKKPPNQNR